MPAKDIADRLEIPLHHVLPARGTQLLAAASRGEMLVRTARNDAYSQAVASLARGLKQEYLPDPGNTPTRESGWATRISQLVGLRKSSSEG
ncbi:hypothetical protein D3C85_1745480 [compost metagenome]